MPGVGHSERVPERHIDDSYAELGRIEDKAAGLVMLGVAVLTVLAASRCGRCLPLAVAVRGC